MVVIHTARYENPLKFSGKELDDITGLYDHGARSRNPISTLWYGIDPLFEKYPDFSPYNYCAGNPVKLVDLNGKNWVKRVVDGVVEIYYDRNVRSQKDLDSYVKKGKDGYYAGSVVLKDGAKYEGYTFYNDHRFNKNGSVYKDGKKINERNPRSGVTTNKQIYDIFVGVADNCVDAKTLHHNLGGTSYTGGDNPMSYDGLTSNYDFKPHMKHEYGSIAHDHAYDKANASDWKGMFFSLEVVQADKDLAVYNGVNILESESAKETLLSIGTYSLASFIYFYKSVAKNIYDVFK